MSSVEKTFRTFCNWCGHTPCNTLEEYKAIHELENAVYAATKRSYGDYSLSLSSIITNPNEDVITTIEHMCACANHYAYEIVDSGNYSALLIWATPKAEK